MKTKQAQAQKPPRGMGQIRKELQPGDCTNARAVLLMFGRIAKQNPDAVKAAFGPYVAKRAVDDPASADRMVEFYADIAEYLAEMFDYR